MSPQLACLLCGADTGEITVRLVSWREPIGGRLYESIPRCVRVDDCWARVTAIAGEDWPVADDRPRRGKASIPDEIIGAIVEGTIGLSPSPEPEPVVVAEPDPDWMEVPDAR